MKKKYIISIVILVIIIIGLGSFFIYNNLGVNKQIDKGIELMTQKEYQKSMACFDLVLDDKPDNKKALQLKEMVNNYLDSKDLFDKGDFDKANKKINEINNEYSNYNGFKDDVNSLKDKINKSIKSSKEVDENLDKIREKINKKNYKDAKELIEKLEKSDLDKNQKQQIEDLKGRVNSELSKSEVTDESSNYLGNASIDKKNYLNKLNAIKEQTDGSITGETNPEMKKQASDIYKEWDNALNDIYNTLKAKLPKDKFKELEKDEVKWIKIKEAKAKKAMDEYEGGSMGPLVYTQTLSSETENRCYELVNKYMN
ncbi:lysozyme inhibitor LprI family protein [Clostridium baratii]|uniref:lysozyme inhibitor LprI family protein n=2 Tax=Clostridium baratii TaxID=1561 RepID=UPI002943B5C7|nr:lysozyme inhibitor LprI family protein [Clostridium baratii]